VGAFVGAAGGISRVATGKAFSAAAGGNPPGGAGGPPAWARKLRRQQAMSHGVSAAVHTIRSGDHGGGSTSVNLKEDR
jgi:type IV secretion system protein TrbL